MYSCLILAETVSVFATLMFGVALLSHASEVRSGTGSHVWQLLGQAHLAEFFVISAVAATVTVCLEMVRHRLLHRWKSQLGGFF